MDKRVRMAYDIIHRDFRQELSLEQLADRVDLSPFHFHRLFKEALGQTPRELLNQTRLERAAHLLVIKNYSSLTEVSIDCGFSSLSSFSRAFSAHYQVSPSKFLDSITLYKPGKVHSLDALHVEISYQPAVNIIYSLIAIDDASVLAGFDQTAAYCSYYGIAVGEEPVGVITHEIALKGLCYYAGMTLNEAVPAKHKEKVFTIPEGYYASFYVELPSAELWDFMITWKTGWLDKSPYAIAEPMAFEHVESSGVQKAGRGLKRRISVPVKRKTARMVK